MRMCPLHGIQGTASHKMTHHNKTYRPGIGRVWKTMENHRIRTKRKDFLSNMKESIRSLSFSNTEPRQILTTILTGFPVQRQSCRCQ